MNFGIPNQRKKRVEKYPDTPVLTIEIDGGKGTSRKMSFNEKAVESLGLGKNANVAFSFEGTRVFVGNAAQAGIPEEYGIKVTKSTPRSISDKRTYEYVSKLLGLDNSVENEFELVETTQDGINLFEFQTMQVADITTAEATQEAPQTLGDTQEVEDFSNATLNT